MDPKTLLLLLIGISQINADVDDQKCVLKNPCLCHINEFKSIDISNLIEDTKDKYQFLTDTYNGYTYVFHGCEDVELPAAQFPNVTKSLKGSLFKYNTNWEKVDNDTVPINNYTVIGTSKEINYELVSGSRDYQIIYRKNDSVLASIRLLCHDLDSFIKVNNNNTNQLTLASRKVCIINQPRGLSTGSILLLLLFIGCVFYFVGGGLVLYFIRGARGAEIVPNIDFWRGLPGLIKDGALFVCNGCRPVVVSTADSYDRI